MTGESPANAHLNRAQAAIVCECGHVRGAHLLPQNGGAPPQVTPCELCDCSRWRPKLPAFVAVARSVMRGQEHIATAVSHTMALRIARALNLHKTNSRGF